MVQVVSCLCENRLQDELSSSTSEDMESERACDGGGMISDNVKGFSLEPLKQARG